jgi:hypothetical protein
MQKKHVVEFNSNGKTITISTDDLDDLMSQRWIRKSFGMSITEEPAKHDDAQLTQKYHDLALEYQREVIDLREQLVEAKEKIASGTPVLVKETRQPGGGERVVTQEPIPPRPPQQRAPPVAPQASQGGPRTASQVLPQQSVLDINPNQMTEQIWTGLSSDEQAQWQARYMQQSPPQ